MFLSQNTVWIFTLDNVSKSKITTKAKEHFLSFWMKYQKNIEKRYFCVLYCVLMCTCTLMCTSLFSSTRYELGAAGWCGSTAFNVFEFRFKETGFTTRWQTKGQTTDLKKKKFHQKFWSKKNLLGARTENVLLRVKTLWMSWGYRFRRPWISQQVHWSTR